MRFHREDTVAGNPMAAQSSPWFVVKLADGHCEILPAAAAETVAAGQQWGPFPSQGEAIARRVGLIRAGKCKPQ